MCPALHHAPVGDDRDDVRVANGGEPVGDDECRPPLRAHEFVERRLHNALGRRVERGGRLVKYEHRRVSHDRPRDRDALLLSARELQPLLTHLRREPLREIAYEQGVRLGGCLDHLLVGRAVSSHPDVPLDAAAEEHRLLRDQPDLCTQPVEGELTYVHAVELHGAAVDVVEALEQRHERRLAAAGWARERHRLPCLDREAEAVVHLHLATRGV
mmetsp:Transcript_3141/g.6712  ORF Transcript_3141/g.6712 Transcript_3141/m.6712 type:complete len:214 (-) Transcript_3141:257-898(-)